MRRNILVILGMMAFMSGISSCGDEPIILEQNGKVLLGDKYVSACTDFTDEQAIAVLSSSVWYEDEFPYVYNESQMLQILSGCRDGWWLRFKKEGLFNKSFERHDLDEGPEFEYTVKDKILTEYVIYRDKLGYVYSEHIYIYKLVSIDKDRIIYDGDGTPYLPKDFPFDKTNAKTRYVLTAVD